MTTSNEHNNATAQERCSTCGYLTSEREHLGCLRRAVKDLDIATGGPYDAQEVGLTASQFDLICQAIDKADTVTMEGDYMLDSDDCIAVVRVMQALFDIAALRAKVVA